MTVASDLTPYITPALVRAAGLGISWNSFPATNATAQQRAAALLDVCQTASSTMEQEAMQGLRPTTAVEQEFGPDRLVTVNHNNGWTRMQLTRWPVIAILAGSVASAWQVPVNGVLQNQIVIPPGAMLTQHLLLPDTGSINTMSADQGPTAVLIPPGYATLISQRNSLIFTITYMNGWPIAGIDVPCLAGATTIHVDDISAWWNGTAGARGRIYDPPYTEAVICTGSTPDISGATSGPGFLSVTPLQFAHTPVIGQSDQPNQTVLLSAMPRALLEAGLYYAIHYGMIRGATGAVVQSARPNVTSDGLGAAQSWYDRATKIMEKFARAVS